MDGSVCQREGRKKREQQYGLLWDRVWAAVCSEQDGQSGKACTLELGGTAEAGNLCQSEVALHVPLCLIS